MTDDIVKGERIYHQLSSYVFFLKRNCAFSGIEPPPIFLSTDEFRQLCRYLNRWNYGRIDNAFKGGNEFMGVEVMVND